MALWIILGIVVLLVIMIISLYNKLIVKRNNCEEAEAAIDAHSQKRFDLVPNLVETVKGYATHEKSTLEAVISARAKAMNAQSFEEKDELNMNLSNTLKSLFALSESYPELKANQGFLDLQEELSQIEDELLKARKYYNANVKIFNTSIEVFPASLIAGMFGFKRKPYVTVSEEAKKAVKVKF